MRWSAPPCRSSANSSARRSTCAPAAKVLDVAAGNGNVTLAAARRWCDVTSTDYVPALLERGRERAAAERLDVEFREADAEALPFRDASFDVVVSTFGVMFTPDQDKAAAELLRVCKSGGKIGLANWTPRGLHRPAVQDARQAHAAAGRREVARALGHAAPGSTRCSARSREHRSREPRMFVFRYRSPQHWLDVFRTFYGPMHKAFGAMDSRQAGCARGRPDGAGRRIQSRDRRHHGGAERISRSGRHALRIASFAQSKRPGLATGPSYSRCRRKRYAASSATTSSAASRRASDRGAGPWRAPPRSP